MNPRIIKKYSFYVTNSNLLSLRLPGYQFRRKYVNLSGQTEYTMAKDRFDIQEKTTMNLFTETMVIVDKLTGVNYLYVHRGYGGGLTPLIDADGKPIVTKDGYKK